MFGSMGWQTYSVAHPEAVQEICGTKVNLIQELPKQLDGTNIGSAGPNNIQVPKSACLGILGLTGLTAHIALTKVAQAQAGETLVVSSAAGQIGHLVGQIGKILGLHVIGYTGDGEKASWIKLDLGFDWAFNHKTQDVNQTLKIAAPKGVDIFIDAVGGKFHQSVMSHMNFGGRIVQLGNLARYDNPGEIDSYPSQDLAITLKALTITGFNLFKYSEHFEDTLDELSELCRSGKLQAHEHVLEGFENMPKALVEQLEGSSQGKVIVRV